MTGHLYNFVTREYDQRNLPDTDEEVKQYIPQWPPALNLYDLYRQMGDSIVDAYVKVLKQATGFQELT